MAGSSESVHDSPFTINQCVTFKLNSTNYLLWKLQFETWLNSQTLLGHVTGGTPRPPPTIQVMTGEIEAEAPNPELIKWVRYDQKVMAWFFGTLSEEALRSVYGLQTAQEVWFSLAKKYNRISASRKCDLQRRLQSVSKQGKSLAEYLSSVKLICDQLDSIGCPVAENDKIYGVLNGLGQEYESITAVIENALDSDLGLTLDDVEIKLTNFDEKLQAYATNTSVSPHQAFATGRGYYQNRGRGQGHSGSTRGRGYSTRGRGFHQQINNGPPSGSNNRPTCQICNKFGHSAYKCYKRFDHAYQPEDYAHALAAVRISDGVVQSGQEWYADSGATAHISNSSAQLQSVQPYHGNNSVIVGNDEFLPITHVGSAVLSGDGGNIPLLNVLVCPGITKSLLYVSKLTSDYPCAIEFDCDGVIVKDKQTQQLLTRGSRHKDLYMLENSKFMAYYSTRQQATSDEVWHMRLGHPHKEILQQLSSTKAIVINKLSSQLCDACRLGKSTRLPFVSSEFVSNTCLERIHCDLWGPSPVISTQGFRYYVIFIDNYSRYTWFYPLRLKSDFLHVFRAFQAMVETQFDSKIQSFQCDGGGEFTSNTFICHLSSCGIRQLISCPHTPQQNGLAERKHKSITELGLTLMFQSKIPQSLWVEAFFTANYLTNLFTSSVLQANVSPYEALMKQPPSYTTLRVFGCKCFPHLKPYAQNKLDPKSLPCVFLGYNDKYKGYRCFHPPTKTVYISGHVLFDEQSFPYEDMYQQFQGQTTTPLLSAWRSGFTSQEDSLSEEFSIPPPDLSAPRPRNTPATAAPVTPATADSSSSEDSLFSDDDFPLLSPAPGPPPSPEPIIAPPIAENPVHPMTTRAKDGIRKPNPRYALFTVKDTYSIPGTVRQALQDEGWNNAMGTEMDNHRVSHTWDLVPPPSDVEPLSCGWVHKVKLCADGTLDKLKSRLVARGNEQEEGIDYLETFYPVVRVATIRTVLHVATVQKWSIKQLDVQHAFLHGDLKETVYMKQPPGFEDSAHPHFVCKLRKAIYGLKQAPRAWFDKFSSFLLEFGFRCTTRDPSLFVYLNGHDIMYLLLYVDDMLLTGSSDQLIQRLLEGLHREFRMKDMGILQYFLGIQAHFHDKGVFLCQEKYAMDLLTTAGMLDSAPMATPIPLRPDKVLGHDVLFSDPSYFRSLAGKLQYMTLTRPDIQYAVNFVCQKMHSPTVADFTNLKRVLRYIKGTLQLGINLSGNTDFTLRAYSDSD